MAAGPAPPSGAGPKSFIDEAESPPPVFLLAAPPVFLLAAPPVFRAPSGPPARSQSAPRASLGASARSPARPCRPVGALHTGGAWCALRVTRPGTLRPQPLRCLIAVPAINVACNSPATISNHEIVALELQRFLALLNLRPIELHATFVWLGPVVCRETITTCSLLISLRSGACGRVVLVSSSCEACGAPCVGLIRIGCAYPDRLCASG